MAVEQMYREVVEIRDLFWLQEVMLERQLPSPDLQYSSKVLALLREVRMIVQQHEDSIIYIERWCKHQGWEMDLSMIELRRRVNRSPLTHVTFLHPI